MTTTQLNTATKATLIAHIEQLNAEKANLAIVAENNRQLAAYFEQVILSIEKLLANAPFLNKEGKFFKKVYWVITNFAAIRALIEEVVATIKAWRKQIDELIRQQQQKQAQTQDSEQPA